MESNVKKPVWKMLVGYVLFVFLLIVIAMVSSCSSRKVQTDLFKATESSKEEVSSKGKVKKESGSEGLKTSVEQKNTVDEKQEQRVREVFDENGKLKERITELLNSKKTDNSSKTKTKKLYVYNNTDSTFNNTIYRTRTITIKEKSKGIDANNNALYWTLGIIGVAGVILVFIYFYWKAKWKKL